MADIESFEGYIRGRWRDLEPLLPQSDSGKAFARYISAAPVTPLGHTRQTITSTPASLANMPSGAKRAHIYNLSEDTDVWFTDLDGQEPSAVLGFPIRADSWLMYDSEPTSDLLFATVAGTAAIAVAFYA